MVNNVPYAGQPLLATGCPGKRYQLIIKSDVCVPPFAGRYIDDVVHGLEIKFCQRLKFNNGTC